MLLPTMHWPSIVLAEPEVWTPPRCDEGLPHQHYIPDLEACSAFGPTPAEALAELEQAKSAWLEAAAFRAS